MEGIKINKLEIENVKRIKAVKIEPTANGLTIVGRKQQSGEDLCSGFYSLGAGRRKVPSIQSAERRIHHPPDVTYRNEQWFDRGKEGEKQFSEGNGSKRKQSWTAASE